MEIEFDPAKEAANLAKHGISLTRAADLDDATIVEDHRYAEPRVRIYGLLYCAAATFRGDKVRIINLRRAHQEEYRDHAR